MSTKMLLLKGITQVVILTAPSAAKANETGVVASAEICFGLDGNNTISNIDLIRLKDKSLVWRLPFMTYLKNGKSINEPVFTGALAEEIASLAAGSFERVKKENKKFTFYRRYIIPTGAASRVREETVEEASK